MTLTQIKPAGLSKPVDLADNEQIRLGTGNDLLIYHDGTDSYIKDAGTGRLMLLSNQFQVNSADNSEIQISAYENGAVTLYYDGSKKFETTSAGATVTGSLTATGFATNGGGVTLNGANYNAAWVRSADTMRFYDNAKAAFGNADDLKIYHDGSKSIIQDSGTGNLEIQATNFSIKNADGSETGIVFDTNGAVELYYDGSKKFETISGGSKTTGYHQIDSYSGTAGHGRLDFGNSGTPFIRAWDTGNHGSGSKLEIVSGDGDDQITCKRNGAVELFYDGSKKFETTNEGFAVKEGNTSRLSFTYSNSLAFITANGGNEIKVSSGNGDANGIEFWDYTGVNKRCQIDAEGIKFNTDTAAANGLDDYEEGTWTPTVSSGMSSVQYETNGRQGGYTKIGRYVFVTMTVHMGGTTATTGSGIQITGLPFTAKSFSHDNTQTGGMYMIYHDGFSSQAQGLIQDGTDRIDLVRFDGSGSLTGTSVNAGREFRMAGSYMV